MNGRRIDEKPRFARAVVKRRRPAESSRLRETADTLRPHSMDFSAEQKKEIAERVKEVLTVKKTVYKTERPKILIVFEKKESENFFIF